MRLLALKLALEDSERFQSQHAAVYAGLAKLPSYRLPYGEDPATAATFVCDLLVDHARERVGERQVLEETAGLSRPDARNRGFRAAQAIVIGRRRGARNRNIVALPDFVSIQERLFDMVMVLEIVV